MKTSYYSLLCNTPQPFQQGFPNRHDWMGSHVILLAPDLESVLTLIADILPRVQGLLITLGPKIGHQAITPCFYHLSVPTELLPNLKEFAAPFIDLLGSYSQSQSQVAELETELRSKSAKLEQTRSSYNTTLERLSNMVENLKRQKDRLENIIASTHVGTWEWNLQTSEILLNERWGEIIGYPLAELAPLHSESRTRFQHPDDIGQCNEAMARHFRGETEYYVSESRVRHKDGHWVWILDQGKVVSRTEDGLPLWMFGTRQDISERKKFDEVISGMNEQLKTKNKELEQILFVASHDLRAPLVNVAGFSQELSETLHGAIERGLDPEIAEDMSLSLTFIRKSADKMDTLLTGLLKLSRLGRAALSITTLPMDALTERVIAENEYQIRTVGASLQIGPLPDCVGDAVAMNQVLTNLLNNAIKYHEPGRPPVIQISGITENGRSVYCIADNGIGIAPIHQERIFEVFHRLDPHNPDGEGLGLAIVRQNLGRMGGSVWLESTPGTGSQFYIAMPTAPLESEKSP